MPSDQHSVKAAENAQMRLDKWLWAARFYKTRSLATQNVESGHVHLNGQRCKPARGIRCGDRIEITRGEESIEVEVQALSQQRGPAPQAQLLYTETPASQERRAIARELRQLAPKAERGSGRPTKKERREMDRWKGSH